MNRIIASCAMVALCAGTALAEDPAPVTIPVAPGDDIQAAIDGANPGDTIEMADGTYTLDAPITVSVGVNITSASGDKDLVTIDGNGDQIFIVTQDGTTISFVSLVNGAAGFTNNNAFEGGCVDVESGTGVSIDTVCFTNCQAEFVGGGLFAGNGTEVTITDSDFTNCSADLGGGIGTDPNSSVKVINSDFTDNRATRSGGAIDLFNSSLYVEGSCFTNNEATRSRQGLGGAINNAFSEVCAVNSIFCGNFADRGGGAWYTEDGTNNVAFCTFYNNTTTSGAGFEQDNSPSQVSSPDLAATQIVNSIFVKTSIFNNNDNEVSIAYTYYDSVLPSPGIFLGDGMLSETDLPTGAVSEDLFVDAANCELCLNRFICVFPSDSDQDAGWYEPTPVCTDNILIDAGDTTVAVDIASFCGKELPCPELLFYDKYDQCRAVDVVDNPATFCTDEGVENTGVVVPLFNCTLAAVDLGACEYQQSPVDPILPTCKGDLDGDQMVSVNDIIEVLSVFGTLCPEEPADNCPSEDDRKSQY